MLSQEGEVLPGVYACGWLMRGPSGIIGETKSCDHTCSLAGRPGSNVERADGGC